MIPQGKKVSFKYKPSKGLDTENCTYKKYGKEYRISDYINEFKDGTNAKEIINRAGGLNNLPNAMKKLPNAEITIDMSEDLFTINRKLKLGKIAQRKYNEIQAEKARIAAAQQPTTEPKGE